MKNQENFIRGYYRNSKAYYKNQTDHREITFGVYHRDDHSAIGEMSVRWLLELKGVLCPEFRCFDDAWGVLAQFTDLLQKMAEVDGKSISEEDFAKILDSCGFKDLTAYTNPE